MKEQKRDPIYRSTDEVEPQASANTVPIWIVVVFGVLFYASTMYLDKHAGGFQEKVYEPYASLKQLELDHPKSDADKAIAMGREVYSRTCMPCHQASGAGAPGVAPPLAGSEWVLAPGPNRVIRIVLHGLTGPITVKGTEWNAAMLAWKDTLSDEEVAAVATFVRGNKEWGHTASKVTPEQVKEIRAKEAARAINWTASELEAIPES